MTGEELLERVRGYVGDDNIEMYDELDDAYQTIVRSAAFRRFRWRDDGAMITRPNVTTYLIPAFIRRLEAVWIQETTEFQEWKPLKFVDDVEFERQVFTWTNSDATNNTNTPLYGRVSGNMLEVVPTPNAAYPMRVHYIGDPPALERLTEPQIPASYHLTIAKMAAVRILAYPKYGMNEVDAAQRAASRQALQQEIAEANMPLTFDMANNITGTPAIPKRKVMRS